jgi:gas vesicle protein
LFFVDCYFGGKSKMNVIVSFFVGAITGAVVALLYAPMSGQELRTDKQLRSQAELQRLEAEWQKRMQEVSEGIDDIRQEVTTFIEKAEAQMAAEEAPSSNGEETAEA